MAPTREVPERWKTPYQYDPYLDLQLDWAGKKEGMAGKMQRIYMDPSYGIKYAFNFQPYIERRDVKAKDPRAGTNQGLHRDASPKGAWKTRRVNLMRRGLWETTFNPGPS